MVAPANTSAPARELSDLELGAWRGFLRAHAELTRRLDTELREAHGLSLSAYDVLVQLDGAPDRRLRMSELADSVVLTPSGLTRLIDRLCREGLVERVRCPDDARGSFAALTDRGSERFAEARATHLDDVRRLYLSRFSSDELQRLADAWRQLVPEAGH